MKNMLFISVYIVVILALLTACADRLAPSAQGTSAAGSNIDISQSASSDTSQNDVYKVVIDPGHGGKDKGATSVNGRYEKVFTLNLGKKVADLLKDVPDIKVYMTRDHDTFISTVGYARTDFANKRHADVFISLHGNTYENPNVSGTETFYYHDDSKQLAKIMQKYVSEATGFPDRGINRENLFVCRETNMPAVLIEVGFLSNPEDEPKMYSEDFQKRVAAAIVEGIKTYKSKTQS